MYFDRLFDIKTEVVCFLTVKAFLIFMENFAEKIPE